MFKKIAAGAAAAVAVVGGVLWATLGNDTAEVRVASASYGNILNELVLSGEVVSENVYTVAPKENGRVESVHVKEGDKVTKGQEVIALDSKDYEAQLNEAENNVKRIKDATTAETSKGSGSACAAAQRANVISAAQNYSLDIAAVRDMLSVPAVETGVFSGGLEAELELAEAEKSVETINQLIDGTSMKSGISGVVVAVNTSAGEALAAGQSAMVIADDSKLKISAVINERDVATIQTGMAATFRVAGSGEVFGGTVTDVSRVMSDTGVNGKTARITITPDERFEGNIGSSADVYITTSEARGVMMLPSEAIKGGKVYVVDENDKICVREIECGITDGYETEVLSGILPGEKVVLTPGEDIKDGMKVRIID